MSELTKKILTELYRPQKFETLIFNDKQKLLNYLSKPKELPSFIFYSKSPGTGKTTTAKLMQKYLNSDYLKLNASSDRGIDIIRQRVKQFASSLSSNPEIKRMVFMDEFDGMTSIAQNSLRNVMEEYSGNVFFILTANNIHKIIKPLQSRCILFDFDSPNKKEIFKRLEYIAEKEQIEYIPSALDELINIYYPDVRNMINCLQNAKTNNESLEIFLNHALNFDEIWEIIKNKNITALKDKIFKNKIDVIQCNNYLFKKIMNNWENIGFNKASKIIYLLADNELSFAQMVNSDIIFLSNSLKIMELF